MILPPSYVRTIVLFPAMFITLMNISISIKVPSSGNYYPTNDGLINQRTKKSPKVSSSAAGGASGAAAAVAGNPTARETTRQNTKDLLDIPEEELQDSPTNDHELPRVPQQHPIASMDDPETFAGCLQIMDDNHFLIEWLAYHYHVMPMRRLVVLMDPHSKTTPEPILDRWKDKINITLWKEKDIFPNGIPLPSNKAKTPTKIGRHRVRQKKFIKTCLKRLKGEGRAWAFVVDTDEYAMINGKMREVINNDFHLRNINVTLPEHGEPGSVMKVLQQNLALDPVNGHRVTEYPCITMARREFSTKERAGSAGVTRYYGYQTDNFQTFRWRWYSRTFKPGKILLDLRRVENSDFPRQPSVHRPIDNSSICIGKVAPNEHESIFVVNHYPGDWEQMLFRSGDARGDFVEANATAYRIERYKSSSSGNGSRRFQRYGIEEWLPGFIATVGEKEARVLLENVGLPHEAATYLNKTVAPQDVS